MPCIVVCSETVRTVLPSLAQAFHLSRSFGMLSRMCFRECWNAGISVGSLRWDHEAWPEGFVLMPRKASHFVQCRKGTVTAAPSRVPMRFFGGSGGGGAVAACPHCMQGLDSISRFFPSVLALVVVCREVMVSMRQSRITLRRGQIFIPRWRQSPPGRRRMPAAVP